MTLALLAGLAVLGLAIAYLNRKRLEAMAHARTLDAELAGLRVEAKRRSDALADVLTPITWAWEEFDGGDLRLRHHLTQALTTLQAGLAADDVEMTDRMAEVQDPPRRLPKYPQVPAFLATPEDVAQVPLQMVKDLTPVEVRQAEIEAIQREGFQVGPRDPFEGMS